jgi:hypothetical protein
MKEMGEKGAGRATTYNGDPGPIWNLRHVPPPSRGEPHSEAH